MQGSNFEYTLLNENTHVNNDNNSESVKCSCSPKTVGIVLKVLAGMVGTACIVAGSLLAKGLIVLGTVAASALAAKILIPVGCVILVVLLVKMAFDCNKATNELAGDMSGREYQNYANY